MLAGWAMGLVAFAMAASSAHAAEAVAELHPRVMEGENIRVTFDEATGMLLGLERADDSRHVNLLAPRPAAGHALGHVFVRYRRADGDWKSVASWRSASTRDGSREIRVDASGRGFTMRMTPAEAEPGAAPQIEIVERFSIGEGGLLWQVSVRNLSGAALELGDLGVALPFNTDFRREQDPIVTYSRYVLRHALIEGANSYAYWMRPDGVGPYLLMTPERGSALEYQDMGEGGYRVYAHALAEARDFTPNGTWNQPLSGITLQPAGQAGSDTGLFLKLQWARDYDDVRARIVDEGGLDVRVLPGMTIPRDLTASASLRAATAITAVEAQYPDQTRITRRPSPAPGRSLYQFRFDRLGENNITVRWADGKRTQLEYFVTEPLATLVKKRAAFIVANQQVRDPAKWYDGLFSLWDMEEGKLRTPDDPAGLDGYMVGGSDDPDLSKAPLIAEKNVRYPVDGEIAALEYYAERFVWGKLQRTDRETPDPYGIYGVLNWKAQRESAENSLGRGRQKMWRSYDYPHLIQFYLAMYRIGKLYPGKLKYLTAAQWLDRANGTARAYFLVPYSIEMDPRTGFPGYNDWSYKLGTMHEAHIVDLIDTLRAEGRPGDADWLTGEWEKKVKYFTYDTRYPFGSEMNFDTTAFQSSHALTRYGLTRPMTPDRDLWQDKNSGRWYSHPNVRTTDFAVAMRRGVEANRAARGWLEPSYYQLGSDYRGSGLHSFLTYMSQMGGAGILDYGLNFASDPADYLNLGYASQLSAWALMNSGDAASNYGYWHGGRWNDGAAGWAFLPAKYGVSVYGTRIQQGRGAWRYDGEIDNGYSEAIDNASTVVARDPVFGLAAYGGTVVADGATLRVSSHDEVRQKLFVRVDRLSLDIVLDRDGLADGREAQLALDGSRLAFDLENRDGSAHVTTVRIRGLPPGRYRCACGERGTVVRAPGGNRETDLSVDVRPSGTTAVSLSRM